METQDSLVFEVSVEQSVNALHALRLPDGSLESLHGHDWKVRVTFASNALDTCGMVVDFHQAERALREVLAPLSHSNLMAVLEIARHNNSAEALARWVFLQMQERGPTGLFAVEVEESPGCRATCRLRR